MAVTVEMHNTGDPGIQAEVFAAIEHVLSDRPGDWRVSILGFQANDRWEVKITGPNSFERSYTLVKRYRPLSASRSLGRACFVLLLALVGVVTAAAQTLKTSGTLEGTISDATVLKILNSK